MSNAQQRLVCFDTDRIKQYLFATNRLKEIRGGSAMIASLDSKRKRNLEQRYGAQNVVYFAGGGAAVSVPSPTPVPCCSQLASRPTGPTTATGATKSGNRVLVTISMSIPHTSFWKK